MENQSEVLSPNQVVVYMLHHIEMCFSRGNWMLREIMDGIHDIGLGPDCCVHDPSMDWYSCWSTAGPSKLGSFKSTAIRVENGCMLSSWIQPIIFWIYCHWSMEIVLATQSQVISIARNLSEHVLTAGLWWISTNQLREASLLVLGEGLLLEH